MSVEQTRAVITSYLNGHAAETIADDAVFTVMGTGEVASGRAAIGRMLRDLYETAFDARADARNVVVDDGTATIEYDFLGRHIGKFGGRPATGAEVKVPFCVAYDVAAGKIVAARIYFELGALLNQIDASAAG